MSDRLFTARFFTMCAFSFIVFVSVFQLLPVAPYHVIGLGGSTFAAGLFLGILTYASAVSAPFTGALADRIGHRRVLVSVSVALAAFTASYAVIPDHKWLLVVVAAHGVFWSALLSASGAYMTAILPASRRAEGLGYWGLASVLAIGTAPALGFLVYEFGWVALCAEITVLNLLMAAIAWRLPDDEATHAAGVGTEGQTMDVARPAVHRSIEWRVLLLAVSLALISFAYGGLTSFSALYADELAVTPRSVFLTAMAASILVTRLLLGRSLDRIGHRRVLLPCLVAPPIGLAMLAMAQGRVSFAAAAVVFGLGFGLMFPAFTAYVMAHVPAMRRGAAYGAILAAFDTGIGTGSTAMGWFVHHGGFRLSFAITAVVAALALPAFLAAERGLFSSRFT